MVADAPGQEEALRAFLEFVDGRVLIAHNAHGFDIRFLKACAERYGVPFGNTYIDTLPLAQALYLGLRNYKLDTIGKYLEIPPFQHHRACDDAKALAQIYVKMIEDLALRGVTALENVNTGLGGTRELAKEMNFAPHHSGTQCGGFEKSVPYHFGRSIWIISSRFRVCRAAF